MNSTTSLHLANQIRLEQADIKREMRSLPEEDSLRFAVMQLTELPNSVQRMRVGQFLKSVKGLGDRQVSIICGYFRFNPEHRIGPDSPQSGNGYLHKTLTGRQRIDLIHLLNVRADTRV